MQHGFVKATTAARFLNAALRVGSVRYTAHALEMIEAAELTRARSWNATSRWLQRAPCHRAGVAPVDPWCMADDSSSCSRSWPPTWSS